MNEKVMTQCPNCGSALHFDEKALLARCSFCGTEIPLRKLIQRVSPDHYTPRKTRKPFYWRSLLYIWLGFLAVILILQLVFMTNEKSGVAYSRYHLITDIFDYTLAIGIFLCVVILVCKAFSFLILKIKNRIHHQDKEDELQEIKRIVEEAFQNTSYSNFNDSFH